MVTLTEKRSSLGGNLSFNIPTPTAYQKPRFYNPDTASFTSLDSFEGNKHDPQSFHKYLYCHADPVNGIDPTGMMTLGSLGAGMGARIGMAATRFQSGMNIAGAAYFAAVASRWVGRVIAAGFYGSGPIVGEQPDAFVFSLQSSLSVGVPLVPGNDVFGKMGFMGQSFVDYVIFDSDPKWIHVYSAYGKGLGTSGAMTCLEGGFLWDCNKPSDYSGAFMSASASLITPTDLEGNFMGLPTGFGSLMNGSFFGSSAFGGAGSLFYNPDDLQQGAYGFSIGGAVGGNAKKWIKGESVGGIGHSVIDSYYTYLGKVPISLIDCFRSLTTSSGIEGISRFLILHGYELYEALTSFGDDE